MNVFLTTLSYIFTWSSMYIFGLTLFRFKIRFYSIQILFSVVILTNISTFLQVERNSFLIPIALPICCCLTYWLIFRFRLFNSILIGLSIYLIGIPIEIIANYILSLFGIFQETLTYVLITCSWIALVFFTLSYFSHKYRLGFSFISKNQKQDETSYKNPKLIFLFFIGFVCIMPGFFIFEYLRGLLLPINILILIILFVMVRLYYKYELK